MQIRATAGRKGINALVQILQVRYAVPVEWEKGIDTFIQILQVRYVVPVE